MKKIEIKNYQLKISKEQLNPRRMDIIIKSFLFKKVGLQYGEDFLDWYYWHVINIRKEIAYHFQGYDFKVQIEITPKDIWNDLELVEERLKVGL